MLHRVHLGQSETMGKHKEREKEKKKKKTRAEESSPVKENKEKLDVKIETSGENPDKQSPIVGYFPTGYDPLKHPSEGGQSETEAKIKVYRNVKRTNRIQLVVSPNKSKVDFVGTNYSGEATGVQLCTYGLGVLDKSTQTLKIVPIAANKIFRLEPRVRGLSLHENEEPQMVNLLTEEEKALKTKKLNSKYSTSRTIKQAQKMESLRSIGGPQTQEEMDEKMKGIKTNKEALEIAATSARNIPPHVLDATTPQMAYPLEKIIFRGEWDYLLDVLHLSKAGGKVSSDVYPTFVCHRFHKLDDIEDEAEKRQFAGILSYITHLVNFKDRHSMDGFSSAKHHKIPSILFQKFSSMFPSSDSRRLPDDKTNLLISYVLVLTLYADNFRTDPSDITKDLRMNAMSIRPHYQFLGCKFASENKTRLATLPLPLQFQEERRRKRKRR